MSKIVDDRPHPHVELAGLRSTRLVGTRCARSGCFRCATGRGARPGIPESPGSSGGAPAAAGGHSPVVGPEALPGGGSLVRRGTRHTNDQLGDDS
jgi:hypothetical protein